MILDKLLLANQSRSFIFTARIRRMEKGNIFTLYVSPHLHTGGFPIHPDMGYLQPPWQGGVLRVPPLRLDGVPPIRTGCNYPHQDWVGVPLFWLDGVPRLLSRIDGGTPPGWDWMGVPQLRKAVCLLHSRRRTFLFSLWLRLKKMFHSVCSSFCFNTELLSDLVSY